MMEDSWAARHKRKRDYFHHVVSLDKIYTDEQQKAKIKQTIEFMQKRSYQKLSTLANERYSMNKSIINENSMIDKKINEKTDHYAEHVLRPQIGRSEPTLLSNAVFGQPTPLNHPKVKRETEGKRIVRANKKLVSRLKFITSSFSQDMLKSTFKNHIKPRRVRNEVEISKQVNLCGRTGGVQIDTNGMTEKFKERVFKGVTFRHHPDPFKLYLGKSIPMQDMYEMLEELKGRRKMYESRFLPETSLRQTTKPNQSTSNLMSTVQSQYIPLKREQSDPSIQEAEEKKVSTFTPKRARKPVNIEIAEKHELLKQRKLDEEEKDRVEFVQIAHGLFRPDVACEKKVVFSFKIKSATPFSNFYVTAQGLTSYQNIASKGDFEIPWSLALDNPVIELEFMTQVGSTETVKFDLMKRHQKISLSKLEGYKVTVAVSVN